MLSPLRLRAIPRSTYSNLARSYTTATNMATAYQIQVPTTNSGILKFEHSQEEADKVSELLQKDLKNHHVFFNTSGFHNHIAHHLCTLYGTGAKSKDFVKAYDGNASYQIKAMHPSEKTVEEFEHNWESASKFLGQGRSYANFLRYYQHEIEKKGWQEVVKEYLFAGDERSNDLFGRLYAGFLHPMIQLMYGIEFEQPAIIAAGLANASVHENRLGAFLTKAEDAANKRNPKTGTLAELFGSVREHEKLAKSPHWDDSNRVYDGVMKRAPDEAVEFVSQVKIREDELEERTAEMIHTAAYVALGAAFHPPNIPKVDFFLMHHINAIPFIVCINKYPWVPTAMKVRLLEWKIRLDLIQYIARGSPPLRAEEIQNYTPKEKNLASKPEDLLPRFHAIPDDGHTIKLVRALLIAQDMSRKYADRPWIRIKNDEMWLKMHYMILDGNEKIDPKWVRSAGFEEAWDEIPKANSDMYDNEAVAHL